MSSSGMAVCIINYNTCDLLRDCLKSVLTDAPAEVIVFDNASLDGSARMVEIEFPDVKLVRSSKNIGFGAAANGAIRACLAEQVVLLNSDTVPQSGFLKALSAYMVTHPTVGIAGPQIVNEDGSPQTSCFHFPSPVHIFLFLTSFYRFVRFIPFARQRSLQAAGSRPAGPVPWVLGAALAIRRLAFEAVGGFDEDFFLYFEETDLSYRMAEKGWQTHFAPVTQVTHIGGASTQQRRAQTALQYFASLGLFYHKHYSPARFLILAFLVECAALVWFVRDTFHFRFGDEGKRKTVRSNLQVWKRLLLGRWNEAILE